MIRFLNLIKEKFNIFVYTAGSREYAEPILDCIDKENKIFIGRLYRDSCIKCGKYFLKDLQIISDAFNMPKDRIILIDNSLLSFSLCMSQSIPIADFNGNIDEEEDEELLFAIDYLKELFEEMDDK